ncbi:MAG: type II/IV secretion system protein [Gammaproteobacteria bacterium]|nr:type II/IV secretion system protein [Gammaproteobacteria bacterium]
MERIPLSSVEELLRLVDDRRPPPDRPLGGILLESGLIDPAQLDQALARQGRERNKHLGRILVESGVLNAGQIHQALARKFGIPCVALDQLPLDAAVLARLPAEFAVQHTVLPLAESGERLIVALENPLDAATLELIRFNTGASVIPVLASAEDIALAHSRCYSKVDEDEALEVARPDTAYSDPEAEAPEDPAARAATRRPIVRLLNAIILQGIMRHASDVNIRPERERIDVYYRVDGGLQFSRSLHKSLLPALVSRLKIIGHMNIAERRLPQEGNARLRRGGRDIDLRVSVIPTVNGESVVIRILDKEVGLKPFAGLGLPEREAGEMLRILQRPHGLLLVAGPTGSGKSTTLYALLNEVRATGAHILSVEDPVEYGMEGVEQVQIADRIGLGFAEVLRRFLRHDPDVIMVGEIRDGETAAIACQAALTGHLVMSTLHTNSAPDTVARLIDMGVEPYILASILLGVMSQRLIRLICPHCSRSQEAPPQAGEGRDGGGGFLRGAGCAACNFTGYRGRRVICEVLPVTPGIAALIGANAPAAELAGLAREQGMVSLLDQALRLAREGRTSLEEALAIAGA